MVYSGEKLWGLDVVVVQIGRDGCWLTAVSPNSLSRSKIIQNKERSLTLPVAHSRHAQQKVAKANGRLPHPPH
ncbi:MAG: hypothetical protein GY943_08245 [Chloroflexi bacterium]|nr:hypothetical protein [Chloroflexota bacterium]